MALHGPCGICSHYTTLTYMRVDVKYLFWINFNPNSEYEMAVCHSCKDRKEKKYNETNNTVYQKNINRRGGIPILRRYEKRNTFN